MAKSGKTLDCENCGESFDLNEMYNCDFCSEKCFEDYFLKREYSLKVNTEDE